MPGQTHVFAHSCMSATLRPAPCPTPCSCHGAACGTSPASQPTITTPATASGTYAGCSPHAGAAWACEVFAEWAFLRMLTCAASWQPL